jgi:hypothetical protein
VTAALGVLGLLTVYLPARQGNVVHVQDMTVRLTAEPGAGGEHVVDLAIAIEPPPGKDATIEVIPTMPTHSNMGANSTQWWQAGESAYEAVADLGMSGPWVVAVVIRRPGREDAVARFRLNA